MKEYFYLSNVGSPGGFCLKLCRMLWKSVLKNWEQLLLSLNIYIPSCSLTLKFFLSRLGVYLPTPESGLDLWIALTSKISQSHFPILSQGFKRSSEFWFFLLNSAEPQNQDQASPLEGERPCEEMRYYRYAHPKWSAPANPSADHIWKWIQLRPEETTRWTHPNY